MVLITAPCIMSWASDHSSAAALSIRSNLLNLFITSIVKLQGIWFRSYLNDLAVFPTFFKLSLNLAIRSSRSEPQSTRGLVFADLQSYSIFVCKEYNQSDFSTDNLAISTCRVFFCVVGRGYWLWPVLSLGKTLLAFALLYFVHESQIYLLFQVSLDVLLLHSSDL